MSRPLKEIICPNCHLNKPSASFYYPHSKNKRKFCAECRPLIEIERQKANKERNKQNAREKAYRRLNITTEEEKSNFNYICWLYERAKDIPEFFKKKVSVVSGTRRNGKKPLGNVRAYELYCLWYVQQGICPITQKELQLENCHVDHIVSVNEGGVNHISNLVFIDAKTNMLKRDMPLELFCQWKHLNYGEICVRIANIQEMLKLMGIQINELR